MIVNPLVNIVLYLGCGILSDVIVTLYYICVARGRGLLAALISIPIALLNFYVLGNILVLNPSWINAIAYAFGNAIGCFLIMSLTKKLKPKT